MPKNKRRRTPMFRQKHGGHGSSRFPPLRDDTLAGRYWRQMPGRKRKKAVQPRRRGRAA